MPIEFKGPDGSIHKGDSVSVSGWSCMGCVVIILLAVFGLGTIIGTLTGIPL